MKKYKYTRTTENLVFVIDLNINSKSLGEASTIGESETKLRDGGILCVTPSRLTEVMSFDIDNPYVVGINGVTHITNDEIKYTINEERYTTRLSDGYTTKALNFKTEEYLNKNFIYDDTLIGVDGVIKNLDKVKIERPRLSVTEAFSKFKNIKNLSEVEDIGNGFYNIFDQSIKQ